MQRKDAGQSRVNFFVSLYHFSRPHTIAGTTISASALYLIAISESSQADWHPMLLIWALTACLCANVYIVGLNQLTDIEIDRINKPYLPLASGALSTHQCISIITVSLLLALGVSLIQGVYLLLTVSLSLLLGTAYSLPPIRLKRFPFWSAFCILSVRGVIVNVLLYLHFQYSAFGQESVPGSIWLLTFVVFVISIVIAWYKDIPDTRGDRVFHIMTLSLQLGEETVFRMGRYLLSAGYLVTIVAGLIGLPGVSGVVLAAAHGVLLMLFLLRSRSVHPGDPASGYRFYRFIWLLFYVEYGVFVAACWAG